MTDYKDSPGCSKETAIALWYP